MGRPVSKLNQSIIDSVVSIDDTLDSMEGHLAEITKIFSVFLLEIKKELATESKLCSRCSAELEEEV